MTSERSVCPDCERPFAKDLAEWRSGFPPATATTGDFCGLDLSQAEHNDTAELQSNCYQTAWSNALLRERALKEKLAQAERDNDKLILLLRSKP